MHRNSRIKGDAGWRIRTPEDTKSQALNLAPLTTWLIPQNTFFKKSCTKNNFLEKSLSKKLSLYKKTESEKYLNQERVNKSMKEKIGLYLMLFILSVFALTSVSAFGISFEGEDPPVEPPAEEPPPAPVEQPPPEMPPEPPQDQPPMDQPPVDQPPMPPEGSPEEFHPQVPEGCNEVETAPGVFQVECDFEFDEPEFQEFDVKEEIENCDGKFEMVEGAPACIKEGKEGFSGVACPTAEEINQMKSSCQTEIKEFTDDKGCTAIMCVHNEFKEHYDEMIEEKYGDDPMKVQAIKCEKDGGIFVVMEEGPKCFMEAYDEVPTAEDLSELREEEMQDALERLEEFQQRIGEIGTKLERLKQGYTELGDTEGVQAVEYGIQKLIEIQLKISTIKSKLTGELTEEQRLQVLNDIQSLRRDLSKVTTAIATGTVPTIEEIESAVAEQFDRFYGSPFENEEEFKKFLEAEKDAMEIMHGCHNYSVENVKSFVPPDPEGFVTNVELFFDGTHCKVTLHTPEGKHAQYSLTEQGYKEFNDPSSFGNYSCTGDCDTLQQIFSGPHGGGGPEEACMEECVRKDCDKSMFECMYEKKEACEIECGLGPPEGEGPFGPGGEIDPFQGCIMVCVGENKRCEPGGSDPVCLACEEKCMAEYGPGIGYEHCLNEQQVMEKEQVCISQNMYGEMVESSTPDGRMCISDIVCKAYDPNEWGDDPMGGPPPGYGPTGQAILSNPTKVFEIIMNWVSGLFR